jgi:membrane fusion protein, multidrug efflux system
MSTPHATNPPPAPAATHPTPVPAAPPAQQHARPLPAATGVAPARGGRRWRWWILGSAVAVAAVVAARPWIVRSLNTVSTDDAYVNGHATFVAPRVAGQVARVMVDDNNRVRKGELLVELDKEPFQVQVDVAKAAVAVAQADVVSAEAQTRGQEGRMRSLRFNLQRSIEDVNNQVALLRSKVATLQSQKATLAKSQADFERGEKLIASKTISKEEFDLRKESVSVAQARVDEALEGVQQVRVSLGLPPEHDSANLSHVPANLTQTFSSVRQAQASLMEAAAQLGVVQPFNQLPREMVAEFYKRDPSGEIDRIYAQLLKDAPSIKVAQSKLLQSQRNLEQAELNLRYCDVVAEIDGVVTRRNVNPGNNVTVGQSLMVVRSLSEIWVDANFKETQLAELRIGQAVDLDVDMYGRRQEFKGRITGFTMGTGSTLALLPPENATGNFVKVVQRLPVRIDLLEYDADQAPLFIGLSVTPYVRINEPPTGPDAGKLLQAFISGTDAPNANP